MKITGIILLLAGIAAAVGIAFFWLDGQRVGQRENAMISHERKMAFSAPVFFDFVLEDYGGNKVRFADFRGRPLVINSFAAWCPFCKKELIDFAAAQKEFGDAVLIIAVDRAETKDTAKKYSDELGVTDKLLFLLDPSDSFYKSIGGFSMPETIFVDSNGVTQFHKRGPMDADEIRERVQALIEAK